jgi:hypothetical protein
MEKVEMIERLNAIVDFANEIAKELGKEEAKQEKTSAKPAKEEKKTAKKEEPKVTIESVINDYALDEMSADELKEFLTDNNVPFKKTIKKAEELAKILAQAIIDGKVDLEDDSEDADEEIPAETEEESEEDAEEEMTVEEVIEEYELNEMDEAELKELLSENEIKIPAKAKKDKLVQLVAENILNGTIAVGDEDEGEESEEEEEDAEEEFEASEERLEAEKSIESDIKKQIKTKKLTIKQIKEFLAPYTEADSSCKGCKKCSDEELIECYINIQKAFIDDEGEVHDKEDAYTRDGVLYCCGVPCAEHPDEENVMVCEICGGEFELE